MLTADLLETIVAATRHSIDARERQVSSDELLQRATHLPRGDRFLDALQRSSAPRIIAECKRRSPSRGILRTAYDPAAHATAYARAGAAAISVLTEPTFFDGSLDHLSEVRAAVSVPILRKDFILSDYQLAEAVAYGADAVLVIAAALSDRDLQALSNRARELGLAALVEVHDVEELTRAVGAGADIVGVNSRNLRTLTVDLGVLDTVAAALPASMTSVAESGIRSPEDISRLTRLGYHAFLVGERLMTEPDPGAALASLRVPIAGSVGA